MRRGHATSPQELAELGLSFGGWFDLEDVAFDPEQATVVIPFRAFDDAVVVEAPPGPGSHLVPRPGAEDRVQPDRYAAWRRWLVRVRAAAGLEVWQHPAAEPGAPNDVLAVEFDARRSEITITDDTCATVRGQVERIDVAVEATSEHVGWGLRAPSVDGVVLSAPPAGSRPIASPSRRSRGMSPGATGAVVARRQPGEPGVG